MDSFCQLELFINTMTHIQEKKLMEKFLTLNYPVYRLKYKKHFKRTIILESGQQYLLSNKETLKELFYKLFDILTLVFSPDENNSKDVLKNFLHLKNNVSNIV